MCAEAKFTLNCLSVWVVRESDNTGADVANVKMSVNPFDEIAVGEAVRLKKKGVATEVVAVVLERVRCYQPAQPRPTT